MKVSLPSSYGRRFLTANMFVELCKQLEVENASLDRLEWLEKKKILFPNYRIFITPGYAKYIYRVGRDPENEYFNKPEIYLPDEWEEEHNFLNRIQNSISGWDYNEVFHPLDKKKNSKYITDPSKADFTPWENYSENVGSISGYDHFTETAIHLYSSWQVFHVYEILKACKFSIWMDVTDLGAVRLVWDRKIPMDRVFLHGLPRFYDPKQSEFVKRKGMFDAISFYIQHSDRLDSLVIVKWNDEVDSDGKFTPFAHQRYTRYKTKVAQITVNRFSLEIEPLFMFLKWLCDNYYIYKKDKMEKLSQAVTRDIVDIVHLISDGFVLTTDGIKKRVGKGAFSNKYILDEIVPDLEEDARLNAKQTIKAYLSSDTEIKNYFNASDNDIDEFLLFLKDNGFGELYIAISEMMQDWFSRNTVARLKMVSHIKNLSNLPESLMKNIARVSPNQQASDTFNEWIVLKKSLGNYFRNEGWHSILLGQWHLTKILADTNIEERINTKVLLENFHANRFWDFCIKTFLIVGITRNAGVHEHNKFIDLDNNIYLTMLKNAVYANFIVWKYRDRS